MRCLANYEAANKKLETAKGKNKGEAEAKAAQETCSAKFEKNLRHRKTGWVGVASSNRAWHPQIGRGILKINRTTQYSGTCL